MTVFFYALVFVLGVLSMGFQLLASRLLSPHFGSSLLVWAWLISVFLAAFSTGSILGGLICGVGEKWRLRCQLLNAGVGLTMLALTVFWGRPFLDWLELTVEAPNLALFIACMALFFVPVTVMASYGPQNIEYLTARRMAAGLASGLVYGISTLGNIFGVMVSAFVLIPHFPVSVILYVWLSVAAFTLCAVTMMIRRKPLP